MSAGGTRRVEGTAAVVEFHFDSRIVAQPHARRTLYPLAAPVTHGIDEQLFQHQVQIELDFPTQGMRGAKTRYLGGQPFEFAQISVQKKIGLVRNCLIVAHAGRAFQPAAPAARRRAAGSSQRLVSPERNTASITAIVRSASSSGTGTGAPSRMAREKASPCRVY